MDATGLGLWLMIASSNDTKFNWPEIKKCATDAIPKPKLQADGGNSMLSPEWQEYEENFRRITFCRQTLAARHDGWAAATDQPDPYPPEPMSRDGDFK